MVSPPPQSLLSKHAALLLLLLPLLLLTTHAKKIDRSAPHHHRGLLSPYTPGPFTDLTLGNADEQDLQSGKSIMKQIPAPAGEKGGRAICVQDVTAPKHAVWNQILDLNHYVGKVDKLKECRNYFRNKNADGTTTIKTKFIVGVLPGFTYEYYCDHTFHSQKDSLTWSLDYDKTSDFNDVAGHWHLEDHPTRSGCTRVFYGCDVKLPAAVPGAVVNFVTKKALKQATSWVKRESESKPAAEFPAEFAM